METLCAWRSKRFPFRKLDPKPMNDPSIHLSTHPYIHTDENSEPGENDVLVRVIATASNPKDWKVRL